jgi:hypothetical protein
MLRAATKRRHLTDDPRACLAREEMEILSTPGSNGWSGKAPDG